jgi:hypothetical protein
MSSFKKEKIKLENGILQQMIIIIITIIIIIIIIIIIMSLGPSQLIKQFGEISQDPPELSVVLKYPLILKNSQFNLLNFQLLSIWTHPYKLGHNIFQKDQNTPNFYLKKKKLEDEILYKSHRLTFTI